MAPESFRHRARDVNFLMVMILAEMLADDGGEAHEPDPDASDASSPERS